MPKVRWIMLYVFCSKFHAFQQCKNVENQLRFDKVTESLKVGTFWHTVYLTIEERQKYENLKKAFESAHISGWCRAVTLPRRETHWNLQGCTKLPDRSQTLVGLSWQYCGDMWSRYCCLTSFVRIADTCFSCKDIVRQSCAMVLRWRFFASFFASCISSDPLAAHFRPAF